MTTIILRTNISELMIQLKNRTDKTRDKKFHLKNLQPTYQNPRYPKRIEIRKQNYPKINILQF